MQKRWSRLVSLSHHQTVFWICFLFCICQTNSENSVQVSLGRSGLRLRQGGIAGSQLFSRLSGIGQTKALLWMFDGLLKCVNQVYQQPEYLHRWFGGRLPIYVEGTVYIHDFENKSLIRIRYWKQFGFLLGIRYLLDTVCTTMSNFNVNILY